VIRTLRIKALAFAALMAPASLLAATDTARAQAAPNVAGPVREYQAQPPARTRPLRDGVTGFSLSQEPRFKVEAVRFHAIDQSGRTDLGSDEVIAVFGNPRHRMTTAEYGDISSGEIQPFRPEQSCIWPSVDTGGERDRAWACAQGGAAGAVRFSISLLEVDAQPFQGVWPFNDLCFSHDVVPRADNASCEIDQNATLFDGDFSYEVQQILGRLDPACRCFEETAHQSRDEQDSVYEVTFRITRTDNSSEPLSAEPAPRPPAGPIVHRSGSLTAQQSQGFELDDGTVVTVGADFTFSRIPFTPMYFLTPNGGAKIWPGDANARGYATCYAQRASANYVTTAITPPAVGQHACYVTSDGRVGEFQITAFTLGGSALSLAYTTWQ
jgi:hypothetical protein